MGRAKRYRPRGKNPLQKAAEEALRDLLSVPEGRFFRRLDSVLLKRPELGGFEDFFIRKRMRKTGQLGLFTIWRELHVKRNVFSRVLSGAPRARFHIAPKIPKSNKEIKKQLKNINRQIAGIRSKL